MATLVALSALGLVLNGLVLEWAMLMIALAVITGLRLLGCLYPTNGEQEEKMETLMDDLHNMMVICSIVAAILVLTG